jgi:hypothetical protein
MRFMIKEKGGINADVFIEFLNRRLAGSRHTIFLIVDRGPAHRATKTGVRRKPRRRPAPVLFSAFSEC